MARQPHRCDPDTPRPPDPELGTGLLGHPLVIQHSRLAGFRHHAAPALWRALRPGAPLGLRAERDNPHDPQAVAVYWHGHKLGYLPRAQNLVAARLLGRRRPLSGRVRRSVPDADHDWRLHLDAIMLSVAATTLGTRCPSDRSCPPGYPPETAMGDEIKGHCWHCGAGLTRLDLGREADCPGCSKPTHCCRNCRHYAPGRANECMEPQVERVIDKVRANFCELFEPTLTPSPGNAAASAAAEAARRAAMDLFK